jgi:hypothetical protein
MHVYSRSLGVKRRIVNPLKAEVPWEFETPESCEVRRKELAKKYQKMLDRYFELGNHRKNTENIHTGNGQELTPEGGANELSPGDGDPAPEITEEQHNSWINMINDSHEIEPVQNVSP